VSKPADFVKANCYIVPEPPYREENNGMKSQLTVRVRYAETDQMGVAHHGSYFVWMEAARTELLRERGISYRSLEERGYYLPVYEARCQYKSRVRYDDVLVVSSWLSMLGGARITIDYAMHKEGSVETIIAEGQTCHAFTDKDGKVIRTPSFFRDMFPEHAR
jgi:acyl-CoA thioester hydrolase